MLTLKTLPGATEQEVFDQVARHLLTQGELSHDLGSCLYRSEKGLKCAAGCLISDEEYKPEFEHRGWADLVREGHVPKHCADIILRLQFVHDEGDPSEWKQWLQEVANDFGLNDTILEVCDVGS